MSAGGNSELLSDKFVEGYTWFSQMRVKDSRSRTKLSIKARGKDLSYNIRSFTEISVLIACSV